MRERETKIFGTRGEMHGDGTSRRRPRLPHGRDRAPRGHGGDRRQAGGGDDGVMADFVTAAAGRRPGARPDLPGRRRSSPTGSRSRPRRPDARAASWSFTPLPPDYTRADASSGGRGGARNPGLGRPRPRPAARPADSGRQPAGGGDRPGQRGRDHGRVHVPALHDARGRRGVRTRDGRGRRLRGALLAHARRWAPTAGWRRPPRSAGSTSAATSAGVCDAVLGQRSFPRPQRTPGTYYWQAWRDCPSCSGGFEVGPVVRFLIRAAGKASLKAPKRAFAGYPFVVEAAYDASSRPGRGCSASPARAGRRSRRLAGNAAPIVKLSRGRQRCAPSSRSAATPYVSPVRKVNVVKAPGSGRRPSATTARTATAKRESVRLHGRGRRPADRRLSRRCPDAVRQPGSTTGTRPTSPRSRSRPSASPPTGASR